MIRLRAATEAELEARIATARALPFSFRPDVFGATSRGEIPVDYSASEWEIALGRGTERFEAAVAALERWEQFPRELISIHPPDAPLLPGSIVALHAHAGPFHASLACRIGTTLDDVIGEGSERVRRRGFTYRTIEGHVERGEEQFLIEHRSRDDAVTYRIRAVSRPAHPLAWLAQPWVRGLQRRFGALSAAALRRACGAESDLPPPRKVVHRPPCGLPWLGLVALVIVTLAIAPPLVDSLISFAALVLLPAARALLPIPWRWIRSRTASSLWFASALLLAISPALPRGELAAAATAPWLLATLAVALAVLRRLVAGEGREPQAAGAIAAMLLLPVGSGWAFLAHLGRWPGAFPEPLPELTAAHFHYAGCVAPLVLGHAAAAFSPRLAWPHAIAWVLLMIAVALGITFSPALEVSAALAFIALAALGGVLQIRSALRSESRFGSFLLALGGASLFVGLGLAAAYTVLEYLGSGRGDADYSGAGLLPWQKMVPWHGGVMAFGFALASVLGWDASRECSRAPAAITPRSSGTG